MLSKAKSRSFWEKRIYLLLFLQSLIVHVTSSFGQGGTWTWISGSNQINSLGVYGTQGVPSANNSPPALYEPCEWKDKQGNFWIYGGTYPNNSDLWKYNPVTNEWTWVKGNGGVDEPSIYGTQGVANPYNTPGTRTYCAATWVDTSGDFWLFGGSEGASFLFRNDLWKYDISSNQWTWMKGDSVLDAQGVHGIQGVPSPSNTPGARYETCSAWTDSLNNLWLFGGSGFDDNGNNECLNDLCKYDISSNEWTWMKGSAYIDAPANYGTKRVADANNDPGARMSYNKWKDVQGNFWLMGGFDTLVYCTNDIWKYDLNVNEWIWISGTNVDDDSGNYENTCLFDTINLPYSRFEQRSSVTDNCGRFWLFAGTNFEIGLYFNDLWVFDPQQFKWNWINGTNVPNQAGNYGTIGVASTSNIPPSLSGAVAWWGNDNKFYMFGGLQDITYTTEGLFCYSGVWVFNPDTNCIPVCGALTFPPPVADFQVSQASFCANGCINFADLSTNAASWQWSFAGASDSTSTAQNPQNICYSKAGIYNVMLIASNAAGSDTVTFSNYITVNAAPPTPVITQLHDTLFCSTNASYTAYQWFLDSAVITLATDTFLVISKGGNYNVEVTNGNDCKISVGINIVYGIQNYSNDNVISLYPNPATNELIIDGRGKMEDGSLKLSIYNVLGQVCSQSEIANPKSEIVVDVSKLCAGIYFVQVVGERGMWAGRFVKE